jgi:hypothetical protein
LSIRSRFPLKNSTQRHREHREKESGNAGKTGTKQRPGYKKTFDRNNRVQQTKGKAGADSRVFGFEFSIH